MVENKITDKITDSISEKKHLSSRCKWCICLWSVVVVGLAAGIPVGVFVVAPKLGQSAVDMIKLHIHNATFYNMDGNPTPTNGTADFDLTIHSPMFMGAIMKESTITMHSYVPNCFNYSAPECGGGGPDAWAWTQGPMANYTMDEATIVRGDNHIKQNNTTVLFNQSADVYEGQGALRAFYWTLDTIQGSTVQWLNITAEPTLIALGILKIKTKLHKSMVCNCIPGSVWCSPEKNLNITSLERTPGRPLTSSVGDLLPVMSVFCEPYGTNISNATDWNVTHHPPGWQNATDWNVIQSMTLWTPFGDVVLL